MSPYPVVLFFSLFCSAFATDWVSLGPPFSGADDHFSRPDGGLVIHVVMGEQVLRSDDGGQAWVADSSGLEGFGVAYLGGNSSWLFAVGQEGLYRKAINASTWSPGGAGLPNDLVGVGASLSAPQTVYVTTHREVYRSTDGGLSFQLRYSGFEVPSRLLVHSQNPDLLFGSHRDYGLSRSSDGGASWTSLAQYGVVASSPSAPDILYASNHFNPGLSKSEDAGNTWQGLGGLPFLRFPFIAVDASGPDTVYAVDEMGATYKTMDGGASWALQGNPATNSILFFSASADVPGLLLLSSLFGVYRSADGGASWSKLDNGLPGMPTTRLAVDPSSSGTLHAAGTGQFGPFHTSPGITFSNNLGATWNAFVLRSFSGFDHLLVDPSNGNYVYTTPTSDGVQANIYKSSDGGNTWQRSVEGLELPGDEVGALAIAPSQPNVLYAGQGSSGFYRSDNRAATWTPTHLIAGFFRCKALVVHPNTPDIVYGAYTTGFSGVDHLLKTTNGGASWSEITSPGPVTDMIIDPSGSGAVFAALDNGGIYRSGNGGSTWTPVGPAGQKIHDLDLDLRLPQFLFAAAGDRVFSSMDGGFNWMALPQTNPAFEVNQVAVDAVEGIVYIGTEGGVFVRYGISAVPVLSSTGMIVFVLALLFGGLWWQRPIAQGANQEAR